MKFNFDFGAFKYLNFSPPVFIAIGVVIAIVLCVWFLRKKRPTKKEQIKDIPTSSPGIVMVPRVEKVYFCLCGQGPFDLKAMRQHITVSSKAEKGKHGWAKSESKPPQSNIIIDKKQQYRVLVRRFPRFGHEPVIEFSRINEPMGNLFWAEPSLPESGQTYYVKENEDGSYSPYDPRHTPIISAETPHQAYRATHWDVLEKVMVFEQSLWEQISKLVVWVVLGAGIIYTLIQVGG